MSKSITYGLLAFAVSSSLLVAQGEKPAGGWSAKAGSGITYDGGDQFGINMLNFVQARWAYGNKENADDTNAFDVPRARTLLRGHAFNKNINYVLQVDYQDTQDSIVRDAYVHWNFADGIGLRMGQAKTQWGLENTGTIRGTMFTERSSASQLFDLGGDNPRTQGAWLMGTAVENKLRWSVAAINGLGNEGDANDDNELGLVASANFDVLGDYFGAGGREWWQQGDLRDGDRKLAGTIGAGYGMDNTNAGRPAPDTETTAINVNTAWSIQGFQVMGEWFDSSADTDNVTTSADLNGYYLQGTYALGKSGDSSLQWAVGLRYSFVDTTDFSTAATGTEITDISVVVNALYHGHNCKTQFEVTKRDNEPEGTVADTTDYILGVAFQLVF
jgi:phosphate-selective porin